MDGGDEVNDDLAVVHALRLDGAVFIDGILFTRDGEGDDGLKLMSDEAFARRLVADPVIGDGLERLDGRQPGRH